MCFFFSRTFQKFLCHPRPFFHHQCHPSIQLIKIPARVRLSPQYSVCVCALTDRPTKFLRIPRKRKPTFRALLTQIDSSQSICPHFRLLIFPCDSSGLVLEPRPGRNKSDDSCAHTHTHTVEMDFFIFCKYEVYGLSWTEGLLKLTYLVI